MKNNFWQGKIVAVTGAKGFLGSHFVKELNKLGAKVNSFSRDNLDLLDFDQTNILLKNTEVVFSCAALDGNAEFKKNHPAEILDNNLHITANILNAARDNRISDVVLISSAEIYSGYAPNPVREEDDYRLYGGHTDSGYILSKRYGEILASLYQEQYGLRIYLPRPSNIFGPGDHFSEESTRVIPSFITKILAGLPIEIWGDGSQIRQFIFVKDVVQTILTMVEKQAVGKINIATEESITVLNLAKKISKIIGKKANIRLDKTKSVGSKSRLLNVEKMHHLIPYKPVSLEEGLCETIAWYKENKKN